MELWELVKQAITVYCLYVRIKEAGTWEEKMEVMW